MRRQRGRRKVAWAGKAGLAAGICCLNVAASAAATTLASTNDYYYSTPRTTNICGKVMGQAGDYSLIRYEDVAWLQEAWLERMALAGAPMNQGKFSGEPLVWKEGDAGGVAFQNDRYWTNATMQACCISNVVGSYGSMQAMQQIMGAASNGEMTNRIFELAVREPGKTVRKDAITENFATVRAMKVVAKPIAPTETNAATGVQWQWQRYADSREQEPRQPTENTYTNEAPVTKWELSGESRVDVAETWERDMEREEWRKIRTQRWERKVKFDVGGGGAVRLQFAVRDTQDWLRGEEAPKVVEAAAAWGVVELRQANVMQRSEDIVNTGDGSVTNESEYVETRTNALVFVSLGEASWREAEDGEYGGKIVYEIQVAPKTLAQRAADTAGGIETSLDVDMPNLTKGAGFKRVYRSLNGELKIVYLVIRLRPVTCLQGW